MAKYTSKRVTRKNNKSQAKTAWMLIILVGIIMFSLVKFGLPALTRFALLLGDIGSSSSPIESSDNIPPTTPILHSIPQATSSATITISGYAEKGSTVDLYHQNVQTNETLADNEGQFEFLSISLNEGENTFYVKATDNTKNTSEPSKIKSTSYDTTAPEIVISTPQENETFYGISNRSVTIEGSTEEESTVRLNDRFVLVSDDGSFSSRFILEEGENAIEIIATDAAGNQSTKSFTISYRP